MASDSSKPTAFIIVDVQNDFCPGGSLAVAEGDEIVPVINSLRAAHPWTVVALTSDWHPADHVSFHSSHSADPAASLFQPFKLPSGEMQMMWPAHCVQGSTGAAWHKDLVVADSDLVVRKGVDVDVDCYSGFSDNESRHHTELENDLRKRKIERVVCVGLAYDYCVGSTAIDAAKLGFETILLTDVSRSVAPATEAEMTKRLVDAGVKLALSSELADLLS